jgi:hypothetical protein
MKTEAELKMRLNELYDHRLTLRIRRLLRRGFRNCVHNKRVSLEDGNGEFEGRFGLCMNPVVTGSEDAVLKCGNEREKGCQCYKAKYESRDQVKAEFDAELRDPKICGQREPKIAVMMWVLHEGAESSLGSAQGDSIWVRLGRKMRSWFHPTSGSVCA